MLFLDVMMMLIDHSLPPPHLFLPMACNELRIAKRLLRRTIAYINHDEGIISRPLSLP